MVFRHGEVYVYLAILAGCILSAFGQMFLKCGAGCAHDLVELEKSFRQLSVVQSALLYEGAGNIFVSFLFQQRVDAFLIIENCNEVQEVEESEVFYAVEEFLHEFRVRFVRLAVDKREYILEHT